MIDIHSHILPGIDDGARTLTESVEIVKELAGQGVTAIIATPHYITESIYTSPRSKNEKLLGELREAVKAAGVKVRLELGNEIYMDGKIEQLLQDKLISPLAGGKYLLVELPMSGEYPSFRDILLELIYDGHKVVLAHPERYTSFQKDYDQIDELSELGVLMQCNLGSFLKQYGRKAQKIAERMAKEHRIFALGSDAHHCRGDDRVARALSKLAKYYTPDELLQLTDKNPAKILRASKSSKSSKSNKSSKTRKSSKK